MNLTFSTKVCVLLFALSHSTLCLRVYGGGESEVSADAEAVAKYASTPCPATESERKMKFKTTVAA